MSRSANKFSWYDLLIKYKTWAIGIVSTISMIWIGLSGAGSWIYNFAIQSEAAKIREAHIDSILNNYDSLAFSVLQNRNIIIGEMVTVVKYDSCQNKCKYWFKQDVSGTVWYIARIETRKQIIRTHIYSVTYQPAIGAYQYVDIHGDVRHLPHKWERNNQND